MLKLKEVCVFKSIVYSKLNPPTSVQRGDMFIYISSNHMMVMEVEE